MKQEIKRCIVCNKPCYSDRAIYCKRNSACKDIIYRLNKKDSAKVSRLSQSIALNEQPLLAEQRITNQLLRELLAQGQRSNAAQSTESPHYVSLPTPSNIVPILDITNVKSNIDAGSNLLNSFNKLKLQ